jgi:hypothetical protein
MRSIRCAAMAALALALAACWTPPFDESLSISEMTARRLEQVAVIGPVEFSGFKTDKSYFVPAYEALPQDGYWVCEDGDFRIVIRYVGIVSGSCILGPAYSSEPNYWKGLNAVQAMSSLTAGNTLSTGLQKAVHVLGTGLVGSGPSRCMFGIGLNASHAFDEVNQIQATTSGFVFEMIPIGGSALNNDSPGFMRNLLLSGYDAGSYVLVAGNAIPQPHTAPYGVPNISYIVANVLNYSGPELQPGAFYLEYTDEASNTHDLVVGKPKGGGAVVALRWDAANRGAPPTRVPFKRRITDVLHDDTLVARGETETEFFDVDGNSLYSLPTGALRFMHELYDGTTWYSYFTRTVFLGGSRDDSKGNVRFDVYRCPTADLAGIAD